MRWLSAVGLAIAAFAVGICGPATAAEANHAVGRVSPPPPPPPSLPGFTTVITSQPVGPAGGTIGPVPCDGGSYTLTIPPGAFPTTVQITLTCGNLAQLGPFAFPGFTIVNAVGVTVQLHGAVYPGTFLRPLTLTARESTLDAASVVGIWNGASFTLDTNATSAPGVTTVSFDSDPDFGFFSPTERGCTHAGCGPLAITNASQSATRWLEGSALPRFARAGAPVGTTFRFSLNEPARVRYAFTRTVRGRIVTVATLSHDGHTGKNSLYFAGRITGTRTLPPNTYTLRITASSGTLRSNTVSLRFTIIPPAAPTSGNG